MKIATSDQSNLILTIADILPSARVGATGRIIFRDSRATHSTIRQRIGIEIDDKIGEFCGELGLLDYVRYELGREILARGDRNKQTPLTSLPGYEDPLSTSKRLVEELVRLPHKFRIASPLPKSLSMVLFAGIDDYELRDGVRVVTGQWLFDRIDLEFKSARLKEAILKKIDLDQLPRKSCHYICTWHSGFAGSFLGNHSVQEHLDKVRAFQGSLLASGIMAEDFFFDSHPDHSVIVCDIANGPGSPIVLADNLDSDLSYFYENFDAVSDFYRFADVREEEEEGDQIPIEDIELDDEEKTLQETGLNALKAVFAKGDYNRRLFTSCLWLFRSFVSTRQLDVILQATISIEVLMGDRDAAEGVGLTKLLANRCAYLLGRSSEERVEIMNEFRSIYDIRSQIVHTGLHQMDRRANAASLQARALAARILRHEIVK